MGILEFLIGALLIIALGIVAIGALLVFIYALRLP